MKNHAFTLIELLVVVLVIGILVAVALPKYQKAVMKTRYSNLKNMVKSLYEAEQVYFLANGTYTRDFTKLDIIKPDSISCAFGTGNDYVYCRDHGVDMAYEMTYTGRRRCLFYNSNSLAKEICQEETGKTNHSGTEDNGWYNY